MSLGKTVSRNIAMGQLFIGKPCQNADIQYLSGFSAPDDVVYLQQGRNKYMVVSALEYGRACKAAKKVKVLTPDMLEIAKKEQSSSTRWALALLEFCGIRECLVPCWLEHGAALILEKNGIVLHVGDTGAGRRRRIKRPDEVAALRRAQRAAVASMKGAKELLTHASVNGRGQLMLGGAVLTSEHVRTHIEKILLERQCAAPAGTIVACGAQACDPHETGHGPLLAGCPIVIDIFPRCSATGYWGDMTRTFIKGQPSASLAKLYKTVKDAQRAALALVRPGVKACSIHQCVCDLFVSRGYLTEQREGGAVGFIHSTGHGVGLDIHEAPRVSGNTDRLRAGHIITIEPGLYYPKLGGVRIEDTIEVTSTGWRALAAMSKSWIVP